MQTITARQGTSTSWGPSPTWGAQPTCRQALIWININNYIKSSNMHAFWLVLTYDLLEDRRIDDVIIKTFLILSYVKQIDSELQCVCSVIDHRGRQNVVRTSVTLAASRVPLFCSYHILTSSVIYYWTDARQLVFVNLIETSSAHQQEFMQI